MKGVKGTFYVALLVVFIDFIGLGLIYPLFSSMIFGDFHPILPAGTSQEMRGVWLGLLIAFMPLARFFGAPIWGVLSDTQGRKKPLQISLGVELFGYLIALTAILLSSIVLLLLSRFIIGFAAGNMSIVQAAIADLSIRENKTKNYGLYSMAMGAGFTLGPSLGGFLSDWDYRAPFTFSAIIVAINLLCAIIFFKETFPHPNQSNAIPWTQGLGNLKKAFQFSGLRVLFLAFFIHSFAWSYFFGFVPVYLIGHFHFSSTDLGLFYGSIGAFYALSTGLLIRPFIRRYNPETLFFGGNLLTSLAIFTIMALPSPPWLWPLIFALCFFFGFITPTCITMVSNAATAKTQGEALGILASVSSAALAISPIFSGSLVGNNPTLPMWVGGSCMLAVAILILIAFRRRILHP